MIQTPLLVLKQLVSHENPWAQHPWESVTVSLGNAEQRITLWRKAKPFILTMSSRSQSSSKGASNKWLFTGISCRRCNHSSIYINSVNSIRIALKQFEKLTAICNQVSAPKIVLYPAKFDRNLQKLIEITLIVIFHQNLDGHTLLKFVQGHLDWSEAVFKGSGLNQSELGCFIVFLCMRFRCYLKLKFIIFKEALNNKAFVQVS